MGLELSDRTLYELGYIKDPILFKMDVGLTKAQCQAKS